jgi:hypothetical protein
MHTQVMVTACNQPEHHSLNRGAAHMVSEESSLELSIVISSQKFPVLGLFLLFSHLLRCLFCVGKTQVGVETLCVTRPQDSGTQG